MNRRTLLRAFSSMTVFALPLSAGPLGLFPAARAAPGLLNHGWIVAEAQKLAQRPYKAPALSLPKGFQKLTYDQYRDIRYRAEARIWRDSNLRFRLDLLPAGLYFDKPVAIALLQDGEPMPLRYAPDMFDFGPLVNPPEPGTTLPFSGFRVRHPINNAEVWDEFAVFQGASYFRAVGRHQLYGLSARGIAIDTAEPTGEEFPAFLNFWIGRPRPGENLLVVHALLDGPSVAGGYRFTIRPGEQTVVDVEMTVFPRRDLTHIGLAPLTSMFLFNQVNRGDFSDFRNAVHDSSGLQMLTGNGEWLWRPLNNPQNLQISAFVDAGPRGFGLMQRPRAFTDYQDLEARYERRPSAWVEPIGDWGDGAVELIEIPTRREVDDNIIAFWRPKDVVGAGTSLSAAYRLTWGAGPRMEGLASVAATRVGRSLDDARVLYVLDFQGIPNDASGLSVDVSSNAGAISNIVLQPNPETNSPRASFEFDPAGVDSAELRLRLTRNGQSASETWLYRWTPR